MVEEVHSLQPWCIGSNSLDCTDCAAGKYSINGAPTCIDCAEVLGRFTITYLHNHDVECYRGYSLVLVPPRAWLVEAAARSVPASRVLALPLPIRHASPALPANMALLDHPAPAAPLVHTPLKQAARAVPTVLRAPTQRRGARLASTVKLASLLRPRRQPVQTAKLANSQLQVLEAALPAKLYVHTGLHTLSRRHDVAIRASTQLPARPNV